MKRFHYAGFMISVVILLAVLLGCTPSDEPETTPSTLPTTLPSETTEPIVTEPSNYPWEIPEYPQLSYEEYFSIVRLYGYEEREWPSNYYYYRTSWRNGENHCSLSFSNGKLNAKNKLNGWYGQIGTDTYGEEDLIVPCNEEWIFLVLDG